MKLQIFSLKKLIVLFFSVFFCSVSLFGAKVIKVNKKKGYVYINQGSSSGFKKKQKACVKNKNKKKVACGSIVKSSKTKATLRVSKKRVKKIRKGYSVELGGGGKKGAESDGLTQVSKKKKSAMALKTFSNLGVLSQFSYNNLSYTQPTEESVTLWTIESAGGSGITMSLGAEFELSSFNAAIGFYMMISPPTPYLVETDCCQSGKKYMSTLSQTDSAFGLYLDYFYLTISSIKLGAGLEFFMNQASLTATQLTDESDEAFLMYSNISALNLITLRVPVYYELLLGSFGIYAGAIVKIPLVAMGPTPVISLPESTEDTISPDLDQTLDLSNQFLHTKGAFAADISIGVFYAL